MDGTPDSTDRPEWIERRRILQTVGGIGALGLAGCLGGDENGNGNGENGNGENGDENGNGNGENGNGENGNGEDNPWDDYEAPDETPESVVPGMESLAAGAEPPGDATVLWNGEDATLDNWEHSEDGSDASWTEEDGYFEVDLGSGGIRTKEAFGDCHLHIEWRHPEDFEGYVDIEEGGDGQAPGNSGVFLMETYEIQIVQSHDNPTYPSGYAGSFYLASPEGGAVPLVMPINPPGEWNAYDIVWRGPRFDENNELQRYPQLTVFFNGVAVINHFDIPGPNWWVDLFEDEFDNDTNPHPMDEDGNFLDEAPVHLQDHGGDMDVVQFRNVWARDLPEWPEEIDDPGSLPEYESTRGVWEEREDYPDRDSSTDPEHPDHPEQIEPGDESGAAPEDADVLVEGETTLAPGDGDWESGEEYQDAQVHVEWQVAADAEAMGPWRGNSGVKFGDYEIQILDTYENPVEGEQWAGAYTGEVPPYHDAVRASGEWNKFDIVFQGPRDDQPAQLTGFLNGVAVQTRLVPDEPNVDEGHGDMQLRLQEPREEGSEVNVRNVWARSLVHDSE